MWNECIHFFFVVLLHIQKFANVSKVDLLTGFSDLQAPIFFIRIQAECTSKHIYLWIDVHISIDVSFATNVCAKYIVRYNTISSLCWDKMNEFPEKKKTVKCFFFIYIEQHVNFVTQKRLSVFFCLNVNFCFDRFIKLKRCLEIFLAERQARVDNIFI